MVDFAKLTAPFPPEKVSWRVGSTTQDKKRGMALAYIDARDVMARLDEVCGVAGWQNRYPHANGKTVCEIGIKVADEWIWKANGAGDSDVEAEKGALSDAFKRAAVQWGVGRYLYDVDSPWVEIEPAGKSFRIPDRELPKLRAVLSGARVPAPKPEPKPDGIALYPPGGGIEYYARASEWLDALQAGMEAGSPAAWWKLNGELAAALGEKYPQAAGRVREIETLSKKAA